MTHSQQSDDQTTPASTPVPQSEDAGTTTPRATPGSVPVPGPRPGRPAPRPTPAAASPAAPQAAPAVPSAASLEEARRHGTADAEGNVTVHLRGEEVPVGAYPDATPEEALTYFARKFVELEAQVSLLESRVERSAGAQEARSTWQKLRDQLAARGVVGDIAALEERLEALGTRIEERGQAQAAEAAEARQRHLAERENLVSAAEEVAAQDPQQTHWKNSSARMNDLFEAWKKAQREARLPKSQEDALWKRFRTARTTFDKHRRAYFSELDQHNTQAKRAKQALIAEAEALQHSTEWAETAAKYRDLMDRWKQAPRAARREDDALWARFRKAQDVFFGARQAANAEVEEEFRANLKVKEGLLERARAILPVRDVEKAKAQLAPILDAWDEAGMVPRADLRRVEGELQKVQNAVAEAEQREWEDSNPETRARANSMTAQLHEAIAGLERELAEAEAAGQTGRAQKTREALEARRAWLDQLGQLD